MTNTRDTSEAARLRVALERCIEAGEIALMGRDALSATISIDLFAALEPLRHALREARKALKEEAARDTPEAALDVMADALDHSMGPERRRRLAGDVLASMSPDWELRRRESVGDITIANTPESPAPTLADLRPFLQHPRSCAFERYKYEANEDSGPQPPCDCGLAALLAALAFAPSEL